MKKALVILLVIAGLTVGLALLFQPSGEGRQGVIADLPWNVEITESGTTRVFGLTLGESTMLEARNVFNKPADLGLFVSPQDERLLEAYFENVVLGGLSAKIVARVDIDRATIDEMLTRVVTRNATPSGAYRYGLPEADVFDVEKMALSSLTYGPRADVPAEVLAQRFGEPAEKLADGEEVSHWLYPKRGVLITVDSDGRDLIQYVRPADFAMTVDLLKAEIAAAAAERAAEENKE